MIRPLWLAGAALVAALVARPAIAERPDVVVPLVAQGTAVIDGERVLMPREDDAIRQPPGSTLEIAVRALGEGRLVLAPGSGTLADITVGIHTDAGGPHEPRFERIDDPAGPAWSASLAGVADLPIRVRMENRSSEPVVWRRAELAGAGWRRPQLVRLDPPERTRPLNVVVYLIDTLRADHLTTYGYQLPTSPKLAKLARRAMVFRRVYAPGSFTAATVPALFSSRYPSELRARLRPDGPARQTLAEVFKAAGYDTAGFQANFGLLAELGYERGFDAYRVLKRGHGANLGYLRGGDVNDLALQWLEERDGHPFFLYVQTMDPHVPHDPHPRFKGKVHPPTAVAPLTPDNLKQLVKIGADMTPEQRAKFRSYFEAIDIRAYDEDVAYALHEFARFLNVLRTRGLLDDTLIVMTADHGEPLGQHGDARHGASLYEEQIHVPLMIWAPGQTPGMREEILSLIDLPPTILDLAGLPIPESFLGRSFAFAQTSDTPPHAMGELLEHGGRDAGATYVREGPWKLITDTEGVELYHLPTDPGETANVAAENAVLTDYLVTRGTSRIPYHRAEDTAPAAFDEGLSEATRQELHDALRSLGYLE